MTEPADLRSRLRVTADTFLALRPAVLACEPWQLATDFGHGPEAAWGPPEVLAHVTEMLPYWLGEVERILAGWPTPVPFGRVATDEVRIAIIGRDRTVPLRELFDRVEADVARYERRLAELEHRRPRPGRGSTLPADRSASRRSWTSSSWSTWRSTAHSSASCSAFGDGWTALVLRGLVLMIVLTRWIGIALGVTPALRASTMCRRRR